MSCAHGEWSENDCQICTLENELSDCKETYALLLKEHTRVCIKLVAMAEQDPVAYMFPSDLERLRSNELFARAYSVQVNNPDEKSIPLYAAPKEPK